MRRPAIRSLVGERPGYAAGIIGGVTLTSLSVSGGRGSRRCRSRAGGEPRAAGLTLPESPPRCGTRSSAPRAEDGRPCAGSGEVYVRAGHAGSYERISRSSAGRLEREDGISPRSRRLLPRRRPASRTTRCCATMRAARASPCPQAGRRLPTGAFRCGDATQVELGAHEFGAPRRADTRVLQRLVGSEPGQAGLGRLAGARIRRARPRSTSARTEPSRSSIR